MVVVIVFRIRQVLNYTRKHRYPERRSAFTYIDEEQPTRMDYAGHFTEEEEEEVEDVKRLKTVHRLVVYFEQSLFITIAYSPAVIVTSKGDIHVDMDMTTCILTVHFKHLTLSMINLLKVLRAPESTEQSFLCLCAVIIIIGLCLLSVS